MTTDTQTTADSIRAVVTALLASYGLDYSTAGGERIQKRNDMTAKPWDCFAWRVTFGTAPGKGPRKAVTFDYYCGLGHVTKPKHSFMDPRPIAPKAADVLYSLSLDAEAASISFYDWADTYGYDRDSRSAEATYYACCDTHKRLLEVFTRAQLAEISDAVREL
jgi:hypothetical protein